MRLKTKVFFFFYFSSSYFFGMSGERWALFELSGPRARCHAMDCKNGLSRHAPGARNSCLRRDDRRQREPNWSTWIFHYSLIYCLTNPAHYHGSGWQDPTVRRQLVSGVENWHIWSWAVFSLSVYYYYRLFNIPKQLEIVMNNKQRASLSKPVERDTACGKNRGVFNINPHFSHYLEKTKQHADKLGDMRLLRQWHASTVDEKDIKRKVSHKAV